MKARIFGFLSSLLVLASSAAISAEAWKVLVEKGHRASERKDYETALTFYLPAARQGHPFAMNAAGSAYLNQGDAHRAHLWCSMAGLKFGHATDFGCLQETESRLSPDEVKRIEQLAVQCLASQYKSCERLDPSQQANIAAYYATKCRVADPTGSQLNLRTTPNGRIITTIENDISVTIIDSAKDGQGRDWVYIERDESGIALGWAFKRFLNCGPRHNIELIAGQEEALPPDAPTRIEIKTTPVSLISRQQPRSSKQTDQCEIWSIKDYPIAIETCSYSNGGSGYYKIINNSAQPAKVCWSIINVAGKKDRGCHSNLGIGEVSRASCYDCGAKNGGAREVILESFENR